MELKFVTEIPRHGNAVTGINAERLKALAERPGEWAIVAEKKSSSGCGSARKLLMNAAKRLGFSVEVSIRGSVIYARVTGKL